MKTRLSHPPYSGAQMLRRLGQRLDRARGEADTAVARAERALASVKRSQAMVEELGYEIERMVAVDVEPGPGGEPGPKSAARQLAEYTMQYSSGHGWRQVYDDDVHSLWSMELTPPPKNLASLMRGPVAHQDGLVSLDDYLKWISAVRPM